MPFRRRFVADGSKCAVLTNWVETQAIVSLLAALLTVLRHEPFMNPGERRVVYSGELSWRRCGRRSRLDARMSKQAATRRRVWVGSMIASIDPRSAAM